MIAEAITEWPQVAQQAIGGILFLAALYILFKE